MLTVTLSPEGGKLSFLTREYQLTAKFIYRNLIKRVYTFRFRNSKGEGAERNLFEIYVFQV